MVLFLYVVVVMRGSGSASYAAAAQGRGGMHMTRRELRAAHKEYFDAQQHHAHGQNDYAQKNHFHWQICAFELQI